MLDHYLILQEHKHSAQLKYTSTSYWDQMLYNAFSDAAAAVVNVVVGGWHKTLTSSSTIAITTVISSILPPYKRRTCQRMFVTAHVRNKQPPHRSNTMHFLYL